jgi:HK97 family phage portal protein
MARTSLWRRITGRSSRNGAEERGIVVAPTDENLAAMSRLSCLSGVDFGVYVNNTTALKNTALYAGIRIISENIASLPKVIRKPSNKGMVPATNHPAYRLLNVRPNGYTNTFSFWSCIVTWIKGWGNAYAFIERDRTGKTVALHQLHPSWVTVSVVNGHKWYTVRVDDTDFDFLDGIYKDEDILHFMELSLDGIKGVNPIIYNASALGKSLAMEKFAAEFYRKGGNIKAVMETEGHMTDDEYLKFVQHMKISSGNYDTPLLEYGIKYKQLSVDPVAAQLVQSEILSIQDVCRILNIPPHMVAELSHATFSNIEHQTIQFVQYSLRPVIKRIEVEVESKLFRDSEMGKYDVKFVLDGLLRGDTSARAAFYHSAITDGYLSRNEVREIEGLERVDGLDDYLYPLNQGVVGEEPEKQE